MADMRYYMTDTIINLFKSFEPDLAETRKRMEMCGVAMKAIQAAVLWASRSRSSTKLWWLPECGACATTTNGSE